MFGRVNVLVYEKEQAVVIPSSSFKKKDNQYFVYLVHPDKIADAEGEEVAVEEGEVAPEEAAAPAKKKGFSLFGGKKKEAPTQAMPDEEEPALGTVEIRPIEIAYATPDAVEIKEGLEDGDLVITDLEQDLKDRSRIEITETQEGIF
jgi:multidrug efflux pump subunit AcrA (membrane-fusion protein)